jgi:Ca2+-binding RTX toxin-like protein
MRRLPLVLVSLAAATVLTTVTPSYAVPHLAQRDEVTGTPAADDLKGTNGEDVVRGLGGNDAIDGRKGHDVLIGGAGDDSITDWLGIAGQADDGAVDTFKGGTGNDILYVGHGDTVFAGAGDDRVNGYYLGEGDVVHCGTGKDVLVVNEDLDGLHTDQCEKILVKYAG